MFGKNENSAMIRPENCICCEIPKNVYRLNRKEQERRIMKGLTEIRWHGRGGQGAKTAALLLADVAFSIGKHVQGFPEYGPERMGAPITAYDRISDSDIRVHSNIYDPFFFKPLVTSTLCNKVSSTTATKSGS